jgi:hypothetical protein
MRLVLAAILVLGGLAGCSEGHGTDSGCDPACGAGQVCVVRYDGQCNQLGTGQCVTSSCGLTCDTPGGGAPGPCTIELCNDGVVQDGGNVQYVCGEACGGEPSDVFACYGP